MRVLVSLRLRPSERKEPVRAVERKIPSGRKSASLCSPHCLLTATSPASPPPRCLLATSPHPRRLAASAPPNPRLLASSPPRLLASSPPRLLAASSPSEDSACYPPNPFPPVRCRWQVAPAREELSGGAQCRSSRKRRFVPASVPCTAWRSFERVSHPCPAGRGRLSEARGRDCVATALSLCSAGMAPGCSRRVLFGRIRACAAQNAGFLVGVMLYDVCGWRGVCVESPVTIRSFSVLTPPCQDLS